MKYAIFFATLALAIPGAFACSASKRILGWAVFMIFAFAALHESTSISFFAMSEYRGTSRGMEVSMMHIMAFMITLAMMIKGKFRNPFSAKGLWIYFVYLIWSALSFMNAENKMYSWCELWKMIMMFMIFSTVYSWLRNVKDSRTILDALCIPIFLNFLLVVKIHLQGAAQIAGIFDHQNSMAMFMSVLAPIFFSYYIGARPTDRRKSIYGLAFFCATAAAVRTYSRGALACLPIGMAVTSLVNFRFCFHPRMVGRIMPIVVIGVLGGMLVMHRVVHRFLYAAESSANTRVELVECAQNMVADKPYFGVGLNNWGIKINPPYTYNSREWIYALYEKGIEHKDGIVETIYMLVAAECGIPALVLLLLWFAYYWITAIRLCKKLAGTPEFYVVAGLVGGLPAIFLQSCLEWVLKQTLNFSEIMVLFAILSYLAHDWRDIRRRVAEKRKKQQQLIAQDKTKDKEQVTS